MIHSFPDYEAKALLSLLHNLEFLADDWEETLLETDENLCTMDRIMEVI